MAKQHHCRRLHHCEATSLPKATSFERSSTKELRSTPVFLLYNMNRIRKAKKTGVNISKVNRILKRLKIEKQIEMETDMQKTLITLDFSDYYEMKGEKGTEKGVKNDRKTTQETEKEKEKSSKREKVKEKEIKKNIKNNTPLYPPGDDEDQLFNLFWQYRI